MFMTPVQRKPNKKTYKKETDENPVIPAPPTSTDNYSSIEDFFAKNGVPVQSFTLNGATGGTFTGIKGTKITIPSNAFTNLSGNTVTSDIVFKIKEIYSKKDMLLSGMNTNSFAGRPLISGGELFIQPSNGGEQVFMNPINQFTAQFPANEADSSMEAYVAVTDSTTNNNIIGWNSCTSCTLLVSNQSYIYYSTYWNIFFNNTQYLGAMWINCDHPINGTSFSTFTAHANDNPSYYQTKFYIWLSGMKGIVSLYNLANNNFYYSYAPLGYQATLIAFGVKDGKLYSSFTPTTIIQNQTVNFTLSETTTEAFKAQLEALN